MKSEIGVMCRTGDGSVIMQGTESLIQPFDSLIYSRRGDQFKFRHLQAQPFSHLLHFRTQITIQWTPVEQNGCSEELTGLLHKFGHLNLPNSPECSHPLGLISGRCGLARRRCLIPAAARLHPPCRPTAGEGTDEPDDRHHDCEEGGVALEEFPERTHRHIMPNSSGGRWLVSQASISRSADASALQGLSPRL